MNRLTKDCVRFLQEMFARQPCLSTSDGDGNCMDMSGSPSRDCTADTSNASGIEIGLLYFIPVLPTMLHQSLCMRSIGAALPKDETHNCLHLLVLRPANFNFSAGSTFVLCIFNSGTWIRPSVCCKLNFLEFTLAKG